jgi:nucleotide-binding universal stress UspA family protein
MKKIIVPVDFSSHAEEALDFAIQFNKIIGGKILLLHVLELPAASVNYGADMTAATAEVIYRRELIDGISKNLHEWAQKVKDAGQEVAIRTEYGSPYKSIGKEVAEEGGDWVIMGSGGASGVAGAIIGSNAERIIRYSTCPVITLKGKTNLTDIKNMVFASDLSREQDAVVLKAQELQKMLKLNMHVIRVKTPHNFLTEQAAREQLDEFATRTGLFDYTLNTISAEFAEDGIVRFADDMKAGLIVMGTHGRKGIAHFLGGSRAEDVVNHSHVPVITFKIE